MTTDREAGPKGDYPDASRRTHFARERTLLAWWRTGIAVGAVAFAIGGLLPKVSHGPRVRFEALGVGYGILALIFVIGGTLRDRASRKAIAVNDHADVPTWAVVAISAYLVGLIVLSVIAFF